MTTPLETLQGAWQQDYSHVPFETFLSKYHEKNYAHVPFSDFTDKLGLTTPNEPIQESPDTMSPVEGASPWEAGETPTPGEAAKAMEKPVVRPGLQMAGQALGGVGGALVGGVPGAIAGETGGYVAGSYAGDLLYGSNNESLKQRAAEGLAFSVVPRGIVAGASYLGKGAVRSALKIPPTQASEKTAKSAVDTIIEENMRVGEGGIIKGKGIVSKVEGDLNKVFNASKSTVKVQDVVDVIESQKSRFANSSDPLMAESIINKVIDKFKSHPNSVTGEIPLAKAQLMKKELYKELDEFYNNARSLTPKMGVATNRESIAMASEAEGLRKSIMSDPTIPPEATEWLKREGNVMNALRWIKRRANVAANMDPITFNDVMLGGLLKEGVPFAVAVRIGRMPSVMSQVGIWMAKGRSLQKPMQAGAIATKNLLSQ